MKAINTDLNHLGNRVAEMMAGGKALEDVIRQIMDNPEVTIKGEDSTPYVLTTSTDKTRYQMRDTSGKVLDDQPLPGHVLLLLQMFATSQLSEFLMATKIEELEQQMKEAEKSILSVKDTADGLDEYLTSQGIPRTKDDQVVKMLDRVKELGTRIPSVEHPAGFAYEELEAVHLCLDNEEVPRKNGEEDLSIWGRIVIFGNNCANKRETLLAQELQQPSMRNGGSLVRVAAKAELRMTEGADSVNSATSPIEVIIGGYVRTGKTVISAVTEKALRDAGFTNVKLMNPDETPQDRAEIVERLKEHESPAEFFTKEIRITEASAPMSAKPKQQRA